MSVPTLYHNVLLAALLFVVCYAHSITTPLEMRQPKPQKPNSRHGFPPMVRIVEPVPDRYPRLATSLRKIGLMEDQQWTARYHNVQLYGGMVAVGEYYAKVKIGGQMLRVQIDTGSATLAAPVKECTNCKRGDMRYAFNESNSGIAKIIGCDDDGCGENTCSSFGCGACSQNRQACCAKSDHSKCAFHLNFGDGSGAKGVLYRDEFEWGDVKFPVTFGGIRSDSPDFERSQVDGILGMAYPTLACNPSCITPTFESMLQHVKMKDMFTICITYDSGKIVLGDYDPALSSKSVTWVPLQLSTPKSFYSFPLLGNLKVNDVDLELPSYSKAIVDSGTTLIVFTHSTFDKFKKYLQSKFCEVPGLCGAQSWFKPAHCTKISDEDRNMLPTLKFSLQGFDIVLGPSDYLINYASKGPEYWCVGIMALNAMSGGVDVIFGNTVMKKYVTIYDREKERVGFAESDTNCGFDVKSNTDGTTIPIPPQQPMTKAPSVTEPSGGTGGETKSNPPQGDVQGRTSCGTATSCRACANLKGCTWQIAKGICEAGDAQRFMCTLNLFAGKVVYIVGGIFAAVVIVIVVAAVAVGKRRADVMSGDDEIEPLRVDTREAFAIDEEEEGRLQ